jgi:hypothetical protein
LVFNLTSGYKGLTPFAPLLSMLLGGERRQGGRPLVPCSVCYLHETGERLITLPALPVTLDRTVLQTYRPLFSLAGEATLPISAVQQLDDYICDLYFERLPGDPDRLTLSPFGVLAWTLFLEL